MSAFPSLVIDVWSDYVCPFCYLEQPVLQQLHTEFRERVDIYWHAFELREAPVPTLAPDSPYLHDIWQRAVLPMAQERGLSMRLPPVQPYSRKALEAAEYARDLGLHAQMHEALFRAFFSDGRDIGSLSELVDIGTAVGLDPVVLRAALEQDSYLDRVLQDELLARKLGISGVPALVLHRPGAPLRTGLGLSGAQPYESLASAVVSALAA